MSGRPAQRWKPYPAYKDSGVEWLGEVPEGWEVKRLKFCVNSGFQYGANVAAELTDHDLPRYIRITDMNDDGTLKDDTFRSLAYEQAEPYLLRNKDILLARSGATVGKSFMYDKSMGTAAYAGYLIRISVNNTINADYLYAFINSDSYWQWINSIFIQATIQNVSAEKYANFVLPIPSLDEQQVIASFLDRECARIDALIEKKRRLLELLAEKRRAVITQAITRGLDPNAPMKNSGVEWFGKVPEGWEIVKVKYLTSKVGSGKTPSGGATVYQDDGVFFLRSQNVYDEELKLDDIVCISNEIDQEMQNSQVRPGDVLLNITGASLGRTCRVPLTFPAANVNQHVCILRFGDSAEFASWALKSEPLKGQISLAQSGAAREGLNFEEIRDLFLTLPSTLDQIAITSFLDAETAAIDARRRAHEKSIALLREYRASLITHAVTGKIDVREYCPEQ